jgi:hypothetical protein
MKLDLRMIGEMGSVDFLLSGANGGLGWMIGGSSPKRMACADVDIRL